MMDYKPSSVANARVPHKEEAVVMHKGWESKGTAEDGTIIDNGNRKFQDTIHLRARTKQETRHV